MSNNAKLPPHTVIVHERRHKRHHPRGGVGRQDNWAEEIKATALLDAREQFIALGCSQLPRCGSQSAARVLPWAVVCRLGRKWVVRGRKVTVGLINTKGGKSFAMSSLTVWLDFSVSLTLGVVRMPRVASWGGTIMGWVSDELAVKLERGEIYLWNVVSGCKFGELLVKAIQGNFYCVECTTEWLVILDYTGNSEHMSVEPCLHIWKIVSRIVRDRVTVKINRDLYFETMKIGDKNKLWLSSRATPIFCEVNLEDLYSTGELEFTEIADFADFPVKPFPGMFWMLHDRDIVIVHQLHDKANRPALLSNASGPLAFQLIHQPNESDVPRYIGGDYWCLVNPYMCRVYNVASPDPVCPCFIHCGLVTGPCGGGFISSVGGSTVDLIPATSRTAVLRLTANPWRGCFKVL